MLEIKANFVKILWYGAKRKHLQSVPSSTLSCFMFWGSLIFDKATNKATNKVLGIAVFRYFDVVYNNNLVVLAEFPGPSFLSDVIHLALRVIAPCGQAWVMIHTPTHPTQTLRLIKQSCRWYNTALIYITLRYVTFFNVTLRYVCYFTLCMRLYVTLPYVMSRYVSSRYVSLGYVYLLRFTPTYVIPYPCTVSSQTFLIPRIPDIYHIHITNFSIHWPFIC